MSEVKSNCNRSILPHIINLNIPFLVLEIPEITAIILIQKPLNPSALSPESLGQTPQFIFRAFWILQTLIGLQLHSRNNFQYFHSISEYKHQSLLHHILAACILGASR
ncbi:hypothetical protein BOTNAR_0021g00090 [Botryotinia narcissicola]|uniref:Uncharacterized protein n=1 Tax=Botryotinia narcissicola TaxID=278944 RepID=A0A4Z1J4X1_9HELO|nr:hypothetical protein BOTNAR_0021g00090 [Botryotinia narcissicola]